MFNSVDTWRERRVWLPADVQGDAEMSGPKVAEELVGLGLETVDEPVPEEAVVEHDRLVGPTDEKTGQGVEPGDELAPGHLAVGGEGVDGVENLGDRHRTQRRQTNWRRRRKNFFIRRRRFIQIS